LKLKVGDYDIPERCLKFVVLYYEDASVSFAGVLIDQKDREAAGGLRRLAQTRAIPFEAVDRNGVGSTGICNVKDLRIVGNANSVIKFSGRLVRPFQE
jgi:hypothetical protein